MFTGNGGYGSNILIQPAAQNSGNVPFSFGELFRKAKTGIQGIGNYIQNNPEQFAIMADMIGSKLNPQGAFAGVGQAFGKSSLANKAVQSQQTERQQMLDALRGSLQTPSVATPQTAQPTAQNLARGDRFLPDLGDLTPKDQPGPTSYTVTNDGYTIKGAHGSAPTGAAPGSAGSPPPPTPGGQPQSVGSMFQNANPW